MSNKATKRVQGKMVFFNQNKGFGFVKTEEYKDIFVHIKDVDEDDYLDQNDIVSFELASTDRGLRAVEVRRVIKEQPEEEPEE